MPLSSSASSSLESSIDDSVMRPNKSSNPEPFCANSPARFVPEQDLESVLPGIGEDEEMSRQWIEPERITDDACQDIERLSQVSGSGREMHPRVGEEAQHRGSWAMSSPTQLNLALGGTHSFQPLGATTSWPIGIGHIRNWAPRLQLDGDKG